MPFPLIQNTNCILPNLFQLSKKPEKPDFRADFLNNIPESDVVL